MYDSLLDKLRNSWISQPDKPEETPESTLKALIFAAANTPVTVTNAIINTSPILDQKGETRLVYLVEQRCKGIPLAYITGRQQFMGTEILVSGAAMIPRQETEILGNETLRVARFLVEKRGEIKLLDVCCGSGNIILAILANEAKAVGFGSDISSEAIELAKLNARNLALEKRVEFKQGNLFESFKTPKFYKEMDLITCNPPYISSKKTLSLRPEIGEYEPYLAFDGGPYGITVLTKLIREAPEFLKSNSFLCFEVGNGQGEFVERMMKNSGQYDEIKPIKDNTGQMRAFTART